MLLFTSWCTPLTYTSTSHQQSAIITISLVDSNAGSNKDTIRISKYLFETHIKWVFPNKHSTGKKYNFLKIIGGAGESDPSVAMQKWTALQILTHWIYSSMYINRPVVTKVAHWGVYIFAEEFNAHPTFRNLVMDRIAELMLNYFAPGKSIVERVQRIFEATNETSTLRRFYLDCVWFYAKDHEEGFLEDNYKQLIIAGGALAGELSKRHYGEFPAIAPWLNPEGYYVTEWTSEPTKPGAEVIARRPKGRPHKKQKRDHLYTDDEFDVGHENDIGQL